MNIDRKKTLIIAFLAREWKTYHRRPHLSSMARIANLLAIEPPASILLFWRHFNRIKKFFRYGFHLRRNDEGIYFFRPITLSTFGLNFRFPFFSLIDKYMLKLQLRYVLRSFKRENYRILQFIADVHQYYAINTAPDALQCYEITDGFMLRPGKKKIDPKHWYTKRAAFCEQKIFRKIDCVIVTSKTLYESRKIYCHNIHYLTNSIEFDHFSLALNKETSIPDDLLNIPSPRLGFTGYINDYIDFELVLHIAQSHQDWSFIFLGGEQIERLRSQQTVLFKCHQQSNIHFFGHKNYSLLPNYLKGIDVCIMPLKNNDWWYFSSPNKTFQYLAAGKPVVSTDFPEIHEVSKVVSIAHDENEFAKMIEKSLIPSSKEEITLRQKIAEQHSTDKRAQAMMKILNDTLQNR